MTITHLAMIIPLFGLGIILPRYTTSTPGGFIVAILVLTPEAMAAVVKAALENKLQRTMNITLGSVIDHWSDDTCCF